MKGKIEKALVYREQYKRHNQHQFRGHCLQKISIENWRECEWQHRYGHQQTCLSGGNVELRCQQRQHRLRDVEGTERDDCRDECDSEVTRKHCLAAIYLLSLVSVALWWPATRGRPLEFD